MAQFCTQCGNEIKAGSKFCNKCGQPIENPSQSIGKGKINTAQGNSVTNNGLLGKFKSLNIVAKSIISIIAVIAILFIGYIGYSKGKYWFDYPNKSPYAVLHTYGKATANSINRMHPDDMKDLVEGLIKCCGGNKQNAFLLLNKARSLNSRGTIPAPAIGHIDYLASTNTQERNGYVYGTVVYWEPSTKHKFVKFLLEMKETKDGYVITDFKELDEI